MLSSGIFFFQWFFLPVNNEISLVLLILLNWKTIRIFSFFLFLQHFLPLLLTLLITPYDRSIYPLPTHCNTLILTIFLIGFSSVFDMGFSFIIPSFSFKTSEWSLTFPTPTKPISSQFSRPNYFLLTMSLIHISSHYHCYYLSPGPQCPVLKLLQQPPNWYPSL